MKKIVFLLFIASIPIITMGQMTFNLNGNVIKKISSSLPEGSNVNLSAIYKDINGSYKAFITGNEKKNSRH